MADKKLFESLTGIEQRANHRTNQACNGNLILAGFRTPCQQFLGVTQILNRILVSHATQNVTATFAFVQKLSQAKNFQEVVKIQNEFMKTQMNSFNEQAKILGEIDTVA